MRTLDNAGNLAQNPEEEYKAFIEARRQRADEVLAKSEVTGEEYCVACWSWMGFQKSLHIHDRERHVDGRSYVEGCGQICTSCNSEKNDPSKTNMCED